jgi:hypothetical protein
MIKEFTLSWATSPGPASQGSFSLYVQSVKISDLNAKNEK